MLYATHKNNSVYTRYLTSLISVGTHDHQIAVDFPREDARISNTVLCRYVSPLEAPSINKYKILVLIAALLPCQRLSKIWKLFPCLGDFYILAAKLANIKYHIYVCFIKNIHLFFFYQIGVYTVKYFTYMMTADQRLGKLSTIWNLLLPPHGPMHMQIICLLII